MEEKDILKHVKDVLNSYDNPYVNDALHDLVDLMGLELEPAKFVVEGYSFYPPIWDAASDSNVWLAEFDSGLSGPINIQDKMQEAVGNGASWAGKKWRVTWEEIVE